MHICLHSYTAFKVDETKRLSGWLDILGKLEKLEHTLNNSPR